MGSLEKGNAATLHELQWDTDYFGMSCAKAILYKPLMKSEWDDLRARFGEYHFVSIENRNSSPENSRLICRDTKAYLIDVNIQFSKKPEAVFNMPERVQIYQAMKRDEKIIEMGRFPYSKFLDDEGLAKRGGADVYRHWLMNSFEKPDKFYAVARGLDGDINGFLLHSYQDRICIIELIAVLNSMAHSGIGTSLFKAVEHAAHQHGCDEIRVGTQLRNINAINFYHKAGCKQVACHQVYHLWNEPEVGV